MQLQKPLNKYIDHTLLKPNATHFEFEGFLDDAIKYQFASVCVSPYITGSIAEALKNEDVKVCTVVGFPHGNVPLQTKLHDVMLLANEGADEIDFVLNYGDLKSGLYERVGTELENVNRVCTEQSVISKCIIEACYLNEDEKRFMFRAINECTTIDYIKTSTGFGTEGAQLVDVLNWNAKRQEWIDKEANSLIQLTPVNGRKKPIKIKAAGGIRDLETALKFIAAGADRLGMSASVKVMEEWNAQNQTFAEGEETT